MDENLDLNKNTEIQDALQEFEMKARIEPAQKVPQAPVSSETPKIIQIVLKYSGGLIREERQAEYALLAFVVLMMIASLFLFFGGKLNAPSSRSALPPIPTLPLPSQ